MIEVKNDEVFNFEGAFRGVRNPKNSWNRSDSKRCLDVPLCSDCQWKERCKDDDFTNYCIGENDMKLAQTLIKGGSEHRKFLRQIFVSCDINAPLYWWKEADQYRINCTTNSCSTMHKIMSEPFTNNMFSCEKMRGYKISNQQIPNEIDEDTEEWKEFPLNKLYLVSNQGRIKRKIYTTSNSRIWKEKILINTKTSDDYLQVGIKINDIQKTKRVHQIVAITWINNPMEHKEINHINGNKLDNRVENLEWCNSSQNQKHAIQNHLQPNQVNTYKGKLSKQQRDEIINLFNNENLSKRDIAKQFNVSHTTICSLLSNKYNYGEGYYNEYQEFLKIIDTLNELRDEYILTKDNEVWYTLIQLLPSSWNQMRTWTGNYEVLRTIYHQRKNHKLTEWIQFCKWIESLPYAEELIIYTGKE